MVTQWTTVELQSLYAEPSRNGLYKPKEFHGIGVRIVNMKEMFAFCLIENQEMQMLNVTDSEFNKFGLRPGDLLFARRSLVEEGSGKCVLVGEHTHPVVFESSLIRVRLNQNLCSSLFYYYYFRSPVGRLVIHSIITGAGQKGIRSSELAQIQVYNPPLPEQKAIAQALSDVDALIAALDKLIAKKRNIKTGTMQQLLTGKTRLLGFGEGKGYKKTEVGVIPEDWEVAPLAEITNYIKGFAFKSSDFQSSGVRVIRVSDTTFELIKKENEIFINPQRLVFFKKWQLKEFDIIISTVGSKPPMYDSMVGKSTFITSKDSGSLLNQNAIVIRAKKLCKETQIFLHNFLRRPQYINHIEKIFRGNANQANITVKELLDFTVVVPHLSEQKAISKVLSDIDSEIATLEKRRAKTQAIKQGMMQELLTGRTRLI